MLGVSLVASLNAPGMSVVHRKASARPSGSKDRDASNVTVIGSGPERTAFGETITAVGGEVARTVTVEHAWSRAPAPFVTCTHTVRAAPVAADCGTVNVGRAFVESLNEPLSSRSQAYVTASPSGSFAEAWSVAVPPSSTLYGPPAVTWVGALSSFSVQRETIGSWSDVPRFANAPPGVQSELMCASLTASRSSKSAGETNWWSRSCACPS